MTRDPIPMKVEGFRLAQKRPWELVDFFTPERDLFRVWHLGLPDADASSWTLAIDGLVRRPLAFSLAELEALPQRSVTAFHECAGSPITPLVPQRRIGNVTWRGVPLAELLRTAGIDPAAQFVISRGADRGSFGGEHHACYEKDLPLDAAYDEDVLVALAVNGAPLPIDRGGPLRLVVPGFYGTNATKWLTSLTLSAERSPSAFTTRYYNDREEADGTTRVSPVWSVAPNAIIVWPKDGDALALGDMTIKGWAWSATPIVGVEISTDGGATWQGADIGARVERSWQSFAMRWRSPSVGEVTIVVRATDADGRTQPDVPRRNRVHRANVFVVA